MNSVCLNCQQPFSITSGQYVQCARCHFTWHLHKGPVEDAAEFLAAQPTTSTPRIESCDGGVLLGWRYEKVPPWILSGFTDLFADTVADQMGKIVQDGLGAWIRMPITLIEKRTGGVVEMLPSTRPPPCCEEVWKNKVQLARCHEKATELAEKYIGRYEDDPVFQSPMEVPGCWAIPERKHLVRPVFVNGRVVALAVSARWVPGADYDGKNPEAYVRAHLEPYAKQYGMDKMKAMLCTPDRWRKGEKDLDEVVRIMSTIAEEHYLLERHERDARFGREVEALYSASLARPIGEARERSRRILERVVSYFMFRYGLWLELEETGKVDGSSHRAVLVSLARNETAVSLPKPRENTDPPLTLPIPDSELATLFPEMVTRRIDTASSSGVLRQAVELVGIPGLLPEAVALVPVSKNSVIILVNRWVAESANPSKQTVSEYALRALTRLQLTLMQEQRHQDALKQAGFILAQVGHEMAMATDSMVQKCKLLERNINDANTRMGYLGNMKEELSLLGELREKIMIANNLALGGELRTPRRQQVKNFYQDVVVGKANLLTRLANSYGIWIDYQTNVAAPPRPFYSDKGFLGQVLLNMLDNAIKYSTTSQPVIVSAGFKDFTQSNMRLWFSVSNVGVGVPEGEHEFIFKAGTRGSNAASVAKKGSGIGMYVSKRIMKRLNGDLIVENGAKAPERTVFRAELTVDYAK